MIWRSRSLSARSANTMALSRPGSSGSICGVALTNRIESDPRATCDLFDGLRPSARRSRHDGPPRLVHAPPIEPFEQSGELRRAQPQNAVLHLRPAELAILEALGEQAHARAVPEDELHPVSALGPEHVDGARERVSPHRLPHQCGQTLGAFAEVHGPCRHHDPDGARGPDHEPTFSARMTAAIAFALASGPIRTATPSISSSIPLDDDVRNNRRCRWGSGRGSTDAIGAGTSTTAGTNAADAKATSCVRRASRRHPNSCCGDSPCRRATSDTTAPGTNVSSRMRAFSSIDQRRRPPTPLITSIRRSDRLGSSVWSNPDTKNDPESRDRHPQP